MCSAIRAWKTIFRYVVERKRKGMQVIGKKGGGRLKGENRGELYNLKKERIMDQENYEHKSGIKENRVQHRF